MSLAVLLATDDPVRAELSGTPGDDAAFLGQMLKDIEFLAGRDRVVGGAGLDESVAYVTGGLQDAGLKPHVALYPLYVPIYEPHVLITPDGTELSLHPLPPNGPILSVAGPAGIEGPLQDAGDGSIANMEGRCWEGSIALVRADPASAWEHPFEFGARAVIFVPEPVLAAGFVPFRPPYLDLAADLPRFMAGPEHAAELRALAAGGTVVELRGDGRWQPVEAPHVTASIPGSDPALADEVVVLHADLDRSEGLGGHMEGAREAVSAAFLLALAREWAERPPARSVVFSFGSARSRGFATLREWLDEQHQATALMVIALDWDGEGEGLALADSGLLFGHGLRLGAIQTVEFLRQFEAAREQAGVPFLNVTLEADVDRRWQQLGVGRALASEVPLAYGWRAFTVTNHGDLQAYRGTEEDRLATLDLASLVERAADVRHWLQQVVASSAWEAVPGRFGARTVDVQILQLDDDRRSNVDASPVWVQLTGRTTGPAGQLPWTAPAPAGGWVRFRGLPPLWARLLDAFFLEQGRDVVMSRTRPVRPGEADGSQLNLFASRVITLVGWPPGPGQPSVSARDPDAGPIAHEFEFATSIAVLHLPRNQGAVLYREAEAGLPPFSLEIEPPLDSQVHRRISRTDFRMAETALAGTLDHVDQLARAGVRHPQMEGLFALATRELNDAGADLAAGQLVLFQERLDRANMLLAEAVQVLRRVERDARLSFVIFIVLAVPAALTFSTLVAMRSPARARRLIAIGALVGAYLLARWLHPGASVGMQAPEVLLGAALLAVAAAVVCLRMVHRFDRWAAARLRRLARVREIDRMILVEAALNLGAVQMGRRPLRSVLTVSALSLFVFALLSVAAMAPELRAAPLPLRGEATFEGIHVIAEGGGVLATRIPDDVAAWPGDRGVPLEIRWEVAPPPPLLDEDAIGGPEGLFTPPPPPFDPRYVVAFTGATAPGKATVSLSSGFGPAMGLDDALVAGRWLRDAKPEILLPEGAAQRLGLTEADVLGTTVRLYFEEPVFSRAGLNWLSRQGESLELEVVGIVAAGDWDRVVGLDGRSLRAPGAAPGETWFVSLAAGIAGDLPLRGVVATTAGPLDLTDVSAQVPGLPYTVYAGSQGHRYILGSLRAVAGHVAMPLGILLVLGVLIVSNTLLGAVFERREELLMFHVVGMAPYHVRILLITESTLMGALAVVAGWSLTMVAGATLRYFGWYEGLALNAGSWQVLLLLGGVLATCGITALLPARQAAERVAPLDRRAELPAQDDVITLILPFTVRHTEAPALWGFLWPAFNPLAAGPEVFEVYSVHWVAAEDDGDLPELRVEMMLHPRAAGVNQIVTFRLGGPADEPDRCAVQLVIERTTGLPDDWRRLNVRFLAVVRRELLAWELVSAEDRRRYGLRAQDIATNTPRVISR